jgi:hypothetical protein
MAIDEHMYQRHVDCIRCGALIWVDMNNEQDEDGWSELVDTMLCAKCGFRWKFGNTTENVRCLAKSGWMVDVPDGCLLVARSRRLRKKRRGSPRGRPDQACGPRSGGARTKGRRCLGMPAPRDGEMKSGGFVDGLLPAEKGKLPVRVCERPRRCRFYERPKPGWNMGTCAIKDKGTGCPKRRSGGVLLAAETRAEP